MAFSLQFIPEPGTDARAALTEYAKVATDAQSRYKAQVSLQMNGVAIKQYGGESVDDMLSLFQSATPVATGVQQPLAPEITVTVSGATIADKQKPKEFCIGVKARNSLTEYGDILARLQKKYNTGSVFISDIKELETL